MQSLSLTVLPGNLAVSRLQSGDALPDWALRGDFFSVTRTPQEVSVVCAEELAPEDVKCERGWRALQVNGVLDFSLTGILFRLLQPLTEAKISIFALSTYDTDYILVREERLQDAVAALRGAGYPVIG